MTLSPNIILYTVRSQVKPTMKIIMSVTISFLLFSTTAFGFAATTIEKSRRESSIVHSTTQDTNGANAVTNSDDDIDVDVDVNNDYKGNEQHVPYSRSAETLGEKCEAGGTLLADTHMIQKQNFPIQPQTLVAKTKFALRKDSGVLDPNLWADDFEFVAPIVGPLTKEEFLEAANGFGIYEAFPDFDNRYFGFTVDPLEPGRVWFFTRLTATNTGKLFGQQPTNKSVELPPQVFSFKFNEQGLIQEMTVGYAVDRRQGDTGGLGGMFGLFYGIGKTLPFPEGKPYKLSIRYRLFQKISGLISKLTSKKRS